MDFDNWKTQVRKGYLELCILQLIQQNKRMYGFELLEKLEQISMPLKEGTLYPMLNRMTVEKILQAVWETEKIKGHPRKFYSLTKDGAKILDEMKSEFEKMLIVYKTVQK